MSRMARSGGFVLQAVERRGAVGVGLDRVALGLERDARRRSGCCARRRRGRWSACSLSWSSASLATRASCASAALCVRRASRFVALDERLAINVRLPRRSATSRLRKAANSGNDESACRLSGLSRPEEADDASATRKPASRASLRPGALRRGGRGAPADARRAVREPRHARPQDRAPYASLVSVATDLDGAPVLLISRLAGHTRNLGWTRGPRSCCSRDRRRAIRCCIRA